MKYYLSCFIMFLILVANAYSTKFNAAKLEKFLRELKPGISQHRMKRALELINKDDGEENNNDKPDFSRFRFSENSKVSHRLKKSFNRKMKEGLNEKSSLELKYMTSLPLLHQGWASINTEYLKKNNLLPNLNSFDGTIKFEIDDENNLINKSFKTTKENAKLRLDEKYFYFRVNKNYIYFSINQKTNNILFYLRMDHLKEIKNMNDEKNCIKVVALSLGNKENPKFNFCHNSREAAIKFSCYLTNISKNEDLKICEKKVKIQDIKKVKVIKRNLKQPVIVIPSAQRTCNYKWNYGNNGSDWECLCKEGKEQSPIDLPEPENAILSPIKPSFTYDIFNDSDIKVKVAHDKNSLRIKAEGDEILNVKGFGKIVTQDGGVYFAKDIIFHTPSEHTINGKRFPMEIQILHEAKSKGDFGKKVILSFLFKGKPGIYNKFIDDIEFFNLPNPHDKFRKVYNKLFIPDILSNTGDSSMSILKPFSFYTYQGSLSYPPCVENVIYYVASEPIPASMTALDMFKEALRMPDFEDSEGNFIASKESILENYRKTQPLNGRSIFLYDTDQFNPPIVLKDDDEKYSAKRGGHYEKQQREVTNYFYVEGNGMSEVPGAVVVPEEEAAE